jgi:cytidine deaminase
MIKLSIFQRALKEAKASNVARGKVGAVIFTSSGHIITSAHNVTFFGKKNIFTIHAEEFAIAKAFKLKAKERFGKLFLFVLRYKAASDTIANAKPCDRCRALITKHGANLPTFYTNEKGLICKLSPDKVKV